MRRKIKNLDWVIIITGMILVVALISPLLSQGAVVSVNPQNETPYVSSGEDVISSLYGTIDESGLRAGIGLAPALPAALINDLDFHPDGVTFAPPGPAGNVELAPKVLATAAAIGFGGLAVAGIRLLRRKERIPFGSL